MPKNHLSISNIEDLLDRVNSNTTGIFSRAPEAIVILGSELAEKIGDDRVHISEFIIAKVKGLIPTLGGHPEITDDIFGRLPLSIFNPSRVILDKRSPNKYLFIADNPTHLIAIEVRRKESSKTEINTIYKIDKKEQRRLDKFPTA
jgi:hypothetical protein